MPVLDMDVKIVKHIMKTINFDSEFNSEMVEFYLKKFPLTSWTETVITDIMHVACSPAFINFLINNKVWLSDRFRKNLLFVCTGKNVATFNLEKVEFFERDIVWSIKRNNYLPKYLEQQWASRLFLTFVDFHKAINKPLALKLCKNPTNNMILLTSY